MTTNATYEWWELVTRWLKTKNVMNIFAVSQTKPNLGVNCDTKFTIYQYHTIPMSKTAASGMVGTGRTLAEDKQIDAYFGCYSCRGHFRR